MSKNSQVIEFDRLNTEPVLSVSISPDEAYNLLKQLQNGSLESAAQNFTNNLRSVVLLDFQKQKAEIEKEMEQVELRLRQCQGNWLSVDRLSGELKGDVGARLSGNVSQNVSDQYPVQRVREGVDPHMTSVRFNSLPDTPSEYSNTSSEKDALNVRVGNVTLATEGEMNDPATFQQIPLPPAGTSAQG